MTGNTTPFHLVLSCGNLVLIGDVFLICGIRGLQLFWLFLLTVRQRCTGYCWSWWTGYGGERDQKKVVDDVLWCARSLVGKHCYA